MWTLILGAHRLLSRNAVNSAFSWSRSAIWSASRSSKQSAGLDSIMAAMRKPTDQLLLCGDTASAESDVTFSLFKMKQCLCPIDSFRLAQIDIRINRARSTQDG